MLGVRCWCVANVRKEQSKRAKLVLLRTMHQERLYAVVCLLVFGNEIELYGASHIHEARNVVHICG